MKNIIAITSLLTAGTLVAFATTPTGTYEDGSGNTHSFDIKPSSVGTYYELNLEAGTYNNVKLNNPNTDTNFSLSIASGVVFNGLEYSSSYKYERFDALSGSTVGGLLTFNNLNSVRISGNISSGTQFVLNSSNLYLYDCVWNIAEADLKKTFITGTDTSEMYIRGEEEITLNFTTKVALESAMNQGIDFIADTVQIFGISLDNPSFKKINIMLGGNTLSDYIATQSKDGRTISISRAVPEPSLFGLLAGTLALALAGTRRRRK